MVSFIQIDYHLDSHGHPIVRPVTEKDYEETDMTWAYVDWDEGAYQRDDELSSWLDHLVGLLSTHFEFKDTMTGYDLCHFLRSWLKNQGHETLSSVCEVISSPAASDERFRSPRCHVNHATCFWLHIRLKNLLKHI